MRPTPRVSPPRPRRQSNSGGSQAGGRGRRGRRGPGGPAARRSPAPGRRAAGGRHSSAGHGKPQAPGQRAHARFALLRDGMTLEEFIAAAGPIASGFLRKAVRRGHIRLEEAQEG